MSTAHCAIPYITSPVDIEWKFGDSGLQLTLMLSNLIAELFRDRFLFMA